MQRVISDNDPDAIRKYKRKVRALEYSLGRQTTRAAAKQYFMTNLRTENTGLKVCTEPIMATNRRCEHVTGEAQTRQCSHTGSQ